MPTDHDIRELLNNLNIEELRTRDEQEVVGDYELLQLIHNHYTFDKVWA